MANREEAIDILTRMSTNHFYGHREQEAFKLAVEALSVQPERNGRWIKRKDRACWYCSECVTDDYYAYSFNCDTGVYELQDKYCPNCGALMVNEDD